MGLHQTSGRSGLGFLLAITTSLMWGMLPLSLKSLQGAMDASTIVFFRFLVSSLIVGGVLAFRGRLPKLNLLGSRGRLLMLVAILGLGFNYIGYMRGLELTSPATAQVMIQLAPPFLALGAMLFFHERFSRLQWFGFVVLLCGLGGFFWTRLSELAVEGSAYYGGALWLAIAALTWALYGLAQKQLLQQLSSMGIMLSIYVVCTLFFLCLSDLSFVVRLDATQWGLLIFSALNTTLAYGAFAEALHHWEATRISAVIAVTPLLTILFNHLANLAYPEIFDADPVSSGAMLGAVLVVLGSMLTALGGRRAKVLAKA